MPYKNYADQKANWRKWYHRNRKAWFLGKRCVKCNTDKELVLHHEDPSKKDGHIIWGWSKKRREEELKKCVPMCDNCHRIHHEIRKPLVHGTSNGYKKKGCRCDECKEWCRKYN